MSKRTRACNDDEENISRGSENDYFHTNTILKDNNTTCTDKSSIEKLACSSNNLEDDSTRTHSTAQNNMTSTTLENSNLSIAESPLKKVKSNHEIDALPQPSNDMNGTNVNREHSPNFIPPFVATEDDPFDALSGRNSMTEPENISSSILNAENGEPYNDTNQPEERYLYNAATCTFTLPSLPFNRETTLPVMASNNTSNDDDEYEQIIARRYDDPYYTTSNSSYSTRLYSFDETHQQEEEFEDSFIHENYEQNGWSRKTHHHMTDWDNHTQIPSSHQRKRRALVNSTTNHNSSLYNSFTHDHDNEERLYGASSSSFSDESDLVPYHLKKYSSLQREDVEPNVSDHHHTTRRKTNNWNRLLPNYRMPVLQNSNIESSTPSTSSPVPSTNGDNMNGQKRVQQVGSSNRGSGSNGMDDPENGGVGDLAPNNNGNPLDHHENGLNNHPQIKEKKTILISDVVKYRHLVCIHTKSFSENGSCLLINLYLDRTSPYSCKAPSAPSASSAEPVIETSSSTTTCNQFIITTKSDLKKFITLLSEHTNIPIRSVCFKRTLGERQKIVPLSANVFNVFQNITVSKPLKLFINGDEFVEFDFNNMHVDHGNDLFKEKKFEQALEHYNISLSHFPNVVRVMSNIVLCYMRMNKKFEAFRESNNILLKEATSKDKDDLPFFEKSYSRRAQLAYDLTSQLDTLSSQELNELREIVTSIFEKSPLKDASLNIQLNYLCFSDMCKHFRLAGVLTDAITAKKKEESNPALKVSRDYKLKAYHYLLHNAPEYVNYCLITSAQSQHMASVSAFPQSLLTSDMVTQNPLFVKPLPFCCGEWYENKFQEVEELFAVKLWKPFYDNNENIDGKMVAAGSLYILYATDEKKYVKTNLLVLFCV